MIGHEHLLGILRELHCRHAVFLGTIGCKLAEQQQHIGPTFTQWRHLDGNGTQTVEEILTETTLLYRLKQIDIGCRYYADIGLLNGAGAHADELTGLKYTEQAGLGGKRQFSHLIQEYGSAISLTEITLAVTDSIGKCALDMSEQL